MCCIDVSVLKLTVDFLLLLSVSHYGEVTAITFHTLKISCSAVASAVCYIVCNSECFLPDAEGLIRQICNFKYM